MLCTQHKSLVRDIRAACLGKARLARAIRPGGVLDDIAASGEARQLIASQAIKATISAATATSNSHCRLFCARRLKIVLTRRSVQTPRPLSTIW